MTALHPTARRIARACIAMACLLGAAAFAAAQPGAADESNDKYAVFWTAMYDQAVTFNFGPTGAEGWFVGNRAYVWRVEKHSPADGILRENDIIIGAGGKLFEPGKDCRIALGNAITEAETPEASGTLRLTVLQGGKRKDIALRLRVMGRYGPDWPMGCEKSARIIDRGCEYLAARQLPNGHFPSDEEIGTPMAGLLFLASDDPRYLDNARRAAYWIVDHPRLEGMMSWPWGYDAVFLSEYYLATGDRAVLPGLKDLVRRIQSIQAECGSWGHGIPGGYGTVNATGLICFQGLILARQCGLAVDRPTLQRSINMFRRFAGVGHVPYGDHVPYMGKCAGNGKDAMAAVNFKLLGGYDAEVGKFLRTVADSYEYVETGHTGCYFSFFWNSIAVADCSAADARRFWNHWRWYYELSRTWDGGLVGQPYLGWGEAGMKYRALGTPSTTGGMALFYALPKRSLRILGKVPGPFGAAAPKSLAKARELYDRRDWAGLSAELDSYLAAAGRTDDEKRQAETMRAAARRAKACISHTLKVADRHLRGKPPIFCDVYTCSELLGALERFGAASPELDRLQKVVADNQRWVDEGRRYFEGLEVVQDFTYRTWYYSGWQAKAVLGERPAPPSEVGWTTVMKRSAIEPRPWKYLAVADADDGGFAAPKGWYKPGFDDSAWKQAEGPATARPPRGKAAPSWEGKPHLLMRGTFRLDRDDFSRYQLLLALGGRRPAAMVYVNGHKVAEVIRNAGGRGQYRVIPLSAAATDLFRKGENHVAVYARSESGGSVDVGFQARP